MFKLTFTSEYLEILYDYNNIVYKASPKLKLNKYDLKNNIITCTKYEDFISFYIENDNLVIETETYSIIGTSNLKLPMSKEMITEFNNYIIKLTFL